MFLFISVIEAHTVIMNDTIYPLLVLYSGPFGGVAGGGGGVFGGGGGAFVVAGGGGGGGGAFVVDGGGGGGAFVVGSGGGGAAVDIHQNSLRKVILNKLCTSKKTNI